MHPSMRNGSKRGINLLRKYLILSCVIFLVLMINCNINSKKEIDVQGHRGARGLRPENTLAAFEHAMDLGVSTIELDLGVTKDLHVIVYHDEYINGSLCNSNVDSLSLQDNKRYNLRDLTLQQIKSFDCGSKNPNIDEYPEPPRINIPGENIPTLQEVFLLAREKDSLIRFNIEIKLNPTKNRTVPLETFVESVILVVTQNKMLKRVTIQSFNWAVLEKVKTLNPKITTAALLGNKSGLPTESGDASPWTNRIHYNKVGQSSLGLLNAAKEYVDVFSPSGLIIVPITPEYMNSSVEEIQLAGFPVIPWTINEKSHMKFIINMGVDGIITDYPDRLIDLLKEMEIDIK